VRALLKAGKATSTAVKAGSKALKHSKALGFSAEEVSGLAKLVKVAESAGAKNADDVGKVIADLKGVIAAGKNADDVAAATKLVTELETGLKTLNSVGPLPFLGSATLGTAKHSVGKWGTNMGQKAWQRGSKVAQGAGLGASVYTGYQGGTEILNNE
jgi:hypothetical protein